jgi:hypothetical protein
MKRHLRVRQLNQLIHESVALLLGLELVSDDAQGHDGLPDEEERKEGSVCDW